MSNKCNPIHFVYEKWSCWCAGKVQRIEMKWASFESYPNIARGFALKHSNASDAVSYRFSYLCALVSEVKRQEMYGAHEFASPKQGAYS